MTQDPPLSLRIAVVDYDAGNLLSVTRALKAAGVESYLASDASGLLSADAVVLPGVGAAGDAMRALNARGLVEPLHRVVAAGRALLGICLGLQVLFDRSDENNGVDCLGILPGACHRFSDDVKVPQMGWNEVHMLTEHPFLQGIPVGTQFYFNHAYYVDPTDPSTVIGATDYGMRFASIVARNNVLGTQFHPEKSADNGLRLYRNFAAFADSLRFNTPPTSILTADV